VFSTGALAAHASLGPIYSPSDLARIVNPKPRLAEWSFVRGKSFLNPAPAHDPTFTLRELLLAKLPTHQGGADVSGWLGEGGFRHRTGRPLGGQTEAGSQPGEIHS
jgi:hypothetical protein